VSNWNQHIIDEFRAKGGTGITNFGDRLLLLTSYGAKSGKPHTTPLAFTRDGDRYVVIASMGGAPKHPAWYHNLIQNPEAELEVGTEKFRVRATPIPFGADRDRLYAAQAQLMPGFWDYEKKTTRIIPVVVFERLVPQQLAA
jgi:deazaflavin-dependent oxidoreductase (nitroreductase family)